MSRSIPARVRKALLWSGLLLGSVGCQPASVLPTPYYELQQPIAPMTIGFAPGATRPSPGAEILGPLGAGLPERAWVVFYSAGVLAPDRARAVSRMLRRPVEVLPPSRDLALPADSGLLVVQVAPGIVYDACRGPGGRGIEDNWPGNDEGRAVLLPPGCAVGRALQAQMVDPSDLLQGRPLPPGAAMPFTAAIEKYYRRNEAGMSGAAAEPAAPRDSSTQVSTPAPTGNPLLGSLPP